MLCDLSPALAQRVAEEFHVPRHTGDWRGLLAADLDPHSVLGPELEARAAKLGANAVVGVDIDYEVVGKDGSMLMVSVSGTAVVVE